MTSATIESVPQTDSEDAVMSLPLSKIKKIFKIDPEYAGSSASAVYATGAATELFVQYLVEQASMNAKSEKRKKIQYKDLSAAVNSHESLYFLSDTIPRTQTVGNALKEKSINVSAEDREKFKDLLDDGNTAVPDEPLEVEPEEPKKVSLTKGQATLPFQTGGSKPAKEVKKAVLSDLIVMEDEKVSEGGDVMEIDG